MKPVMLLPVASLTEFLGVLTLITNDGMFIPKIDLGFTVPAILPVEVQGIGMMILGGAITAYAVTQMK